MPRRAIFFGSFPLLAGAVPAIRRINEAGWQAVVVTNENDWDDAVRSSLLDEGARLDGVYHCPHAEDVECACRKPRTGLLERARDEMGIDLRASCFLGAAPEDLDAARAAGMPAILVDGRRGDALEQAVARALDGASR